MTTYATDAAFIVENMARRAVQLASSAGVLLGQDKYHLAGGGLLLCVATWDRDPHRVTLRWSLTDARGQPAQVKTEEEAQAVVERHLRERF